jgi:hypothetical protein
MGITENPMAVSQFFIYRLHTYGYRLPFWELFPVVDPVLVSYQPEYPIKAVPEYRGRTSLPHSAVSYARYMHNTLLCSS